MSPRNVASVSPGLITRPDFFSRRARTAMGVDAVRATRAASGMAEDGRLTFAFFGPEEAVADGFADRMAMPVSDVGRPVE